MRATAKATRKVAAIAASASLAAAAFAGVAAAPPASAAAPTVAIGPTAAKAAPYRPVLSYGMYSPYVRTLQSGLHMPLVTGYFGQMTLSYVTALQRANHLLVTGIVNKNTWAKVGKWFPAPSKTSPTSATSFSTSRAKRVLRIAASLAGIKYVANGYTPKQGFNCSSYTQYVYAQIGVNLGGAYTVWQYNRSRHVTRAQARPGDLIFFYNYKNNFIGHVGIYAGGNMFWAAPHTGAVVRKQAIYTPKVLFGRVL